ncbi:MAG: DUF2281 domain-containing protein [Thermofilaceae archaeon]
MAPVREKTLEEWIRELPEELKREVQNFVEFLIEKKCLKDETPHFPGGGQPSTCVSSTHR